LFDYLNDSGLQLNINRSSTFLNELLRICKVLRFSQEETGVDGYFLFS